MSYLTASLEAINHVRDNAFGRQLETEVSRIRNSTNYVRALAENNFSKIIKEHTGLSISVARSKDHPDDAHINCPVLNLNDIISSNFLKNAVGAQGEIVTHDLFNKDDILNGSINRAENRVSGFFEDFKYSMFLGKNYFKDDFYTVRETVGVILHEIGHAFTACEWFTSSVLTNLVVDDCFRRVVSNDNSEQKVQILQGYVEGGFIKPDSVALLEKAKTKAEVSTVIIIDNVLEKSSLLDNDVYDTRMWEKMADQYASRHGYAMDMATGFDKCFRRYNPEYYKSNLGRNLRMLGVVGLIVANIAFGVAGSAIPILNFYAAGLLLLASLIGSPFNTIYDPPQRRIRALRNEVLDYLKHEDTSVDEKRQAIKQIEVIDNIAKELKDDTLGVYDKLSTIISPGQRRRKTQVEKQAFLEDLSSSILRANIAKLELAGNA